MALIIKTKKNEENNKITFLLDGELDLSTSEIFKENVLSEYQKNPSNIEIDFEKIEFIDSTCLGIMINISKTISNNHELSVINLKKHIKKVFTITGLDKIFIDRGEN